LKHVSSKPKHELPLVDDPLGRGPLDGVWWLRGSGNKQPEFEKENLKASPRVLLCRLKRGISPFDRERKEGSKAKTLKGVLEIGNPLVGEQYDSKRIEQTSLGRRFHP
jgi:hypothetical protein